MNANFLSMMAQRFPVNGQVQQSKMMQMLQARRPQTQPQVSIMPVGQPQTIAQPPMRPGNRLMPKGMQSY